MSDDRPDGPTEAPRTKAEQAESNLIANRRARLEQWIVLHTALGGDPTKTQPLATPAATANGK